MSRVQFIKTTMEMEKHRFHYKFSVPHFQSTGSRFRYGKHRKHIVYGVYLTSLLRWWGRNQKRNR